ncbi:MAG TPA: MFS transporter, partial [Candidatus Binatia bacterium]|nr:MFS transporter [Candidatus Binatia bacterium]
LSHHLVLSLVIAVGVGFSLMMQMASSNTILQTIVDDRKRGRVISLFVMARRGVESVGSLVAGVVAHRFGTPETLMIGGIVCLLASVAFATKLSMIRETSRAFYEDMKDAKLDAKPVPVVGVVNELPVVPANP